ncbi:O-methyltransferase MdmC [Lachnellula suecica]|uniref:O-methyltransferase MdmC n=1 Tax=Lachnellula suecica TaxID=602035 RepID=A0A8T9CBM2_9HELO|nr:O-methyltransferase MdmC [Lachnellula suecica]
MASNNFHLAGVIDAQAQDSLLKPNSQLDHALSNSEANGLPPITINKLQGQFLAIQCKLMGAKSVLEIGTLGGYSSIWFANTGAKVTSIEINPKHRDVALENTKGLDVDIILGAALDVLPKLAAKGKKFDFIFIDADWQNQYKYFEWAVKLATVNGCIYVDNVVRELLEHDDFGHKENLVTKVGIEPKVTATLIPTLSSHREKEANMFDGFLMAIVNAN